MDGIPSEIPSWQRERDQWSRESSSTAPQLFWQGVEGQLAIQRTKSELLTQAANRQFEYATLAERQKEDAAFATDAPAIAAWMADSTKNPDASPPTVTSAKGLAMLDRAQNQIWQRDYRQQMNDWRQTQAQNQADAANLRVQFQSENLKQQGVALDGYNALSVTSRAAIDAGKNARNPKTGFFSPDAITAINDALITEGKPPLAIGKQKQDKPLSGLGKLERDRQQAVDNGAPQSVIDSYDAEISKMTAAKPVITKADAADAAKMKGLANTIADLTKKLEESPESDDQMAKPDSMTAKLRKANYDLKALEAKYKAKATPTKKEDSTLKKETYDPDTGTFK